MRIRPYKELLLFFQVQEDFEGLGILGFRSLRAIGLRVVFAVFKSHVLWRKLLDVLHEYVRAS